MAEQAPVSSQDTSKGTGQQPRIYVMPEQFLALTRAAGLPVAPPPPVQPQAPSSKPQAPPAPATVAPPSTVAVPQPSGLPAVASPRPSEASGEGGAKAGPGIPMEEGKRKMFVVWGIVGGVILVGGGLAAFFVLRSVPPAPTPAPPTPAPVNVTPPPPPPPVNVAPPPPEPEPEPEPAPAADQDTDRDGLTDAEEILLGTDVNLADSDRDSYPDATELQNLYNPAGVAPQRILDAGLVYEYEHPTHGWKMYVPRAWSIAATDQEQREIVITTQASGESFTITDRGAEVGAGLCQGLAEMQTKRGANGCRNPGTPMAVIGLPLGNALTIEHHIATPPARYPHIFDMMVQSFAVPAVPNAP